MVLEKAIARSVASVACRVSEEGAWIIAASVLLLVGSAVAVGVIFWDQIFPSGPGPDGATLLPAVGLGQDTFRDVRPVITRYFDLISSGNYDIASDTLTPWERPH